MYQPLAAKIRPKTLDEVVGQKHILGPDGILRRILKSGSVPNMIFYGPSGVGKTTVASIIAGETNRVLHRLNATTASISDIKAIVADLDTMLAQNGVLLYLDEIQYFNKKQQQSLLEFIENGKITLIASTTENPYFYVYNAILSRSTVFEFKQLTPEEIIPAIRRALALYEQEMGVLCTASDDVIEYIAHACGGDVRKAINAVELLVTAAPALHNSVHITLEDAKAVSQRSAMRYDQSGDAHYDILSALQKSIRGSDPDAALHYLARLLTAGDLLSACRRILVTSAEDIGLAHPQAVAITKACVDAAQQLGLPEAALPLGEAVVFLATAPKSNSAANGIHAAMADVQSGKSGEIPRHLQNVHADTTGMEREQGYLYPHNFPNHYVKQQYLPDVIKNVKYYHYGLNKLEQISKAYWDEIKKQGDENR